MSALEVAVETDPGTGVLERIPESALRRMILVAHPDRKSQRLIRRVLGGTMHEIVCVDDFSQASAVLATRSPAIVIIDHGLLLGQAGQAFVAAMKALVPTACVVFMPYRDERLHEVLGSGVMTNLVGHNMPLLAEELVVTANKVLRADLFGLEKYLAWGVDPLEVHLTHTQDRRACVEDVERLSRDIGLPSRTVGIAGLVTDELLSNAIFNAPVDEQGQRTRVDEPREVSRALESRERVVLRYACDARYMAISVTDPYGSLDQRTLLAHLAKFAEPGSEKVRFRRAGAGVGLGLVYGCSNHLVFNIEPGRRCEAIVLLDVRFRPSDFEETTSSLSVFVKAEPA